MHGCALVIEESADRFEECLEDAWKKKMRDLAIDTDDTNMNGAGWRI